MSTTIPTVDPDIDLPGLEKSLRSPRTLFSTFMSVLTGVMTLAAMFPLVSVLVRLIWYGGKRLSLALFTQLPPAAGTKGGGFGNAILGTVVMVGIATLISVPFGILAAVYLAEFGPETKTASVVRFSAKVLTGLPSILAGVFAYAAVVIVTGHFSALAGAIALSLLMLPIILLTAEDAIRMVPSRMREAAIGMGATRTQTVARVLLPTAMPGILTGVMLSVARAAGETAPLLFTALSSDYWITLKVHSWHSIPYWVTFKPMEPTASLSVLIYNFSSVPFDNLVELAWAASLVLVILVLIMNLTGQALAARSIRK